MKNLFDNHNHSQFSFDGKKASVESTALMAKEKGLGGLCFSDHFDAYTPPMKAAFEDNQSGTTIPQSPSATAPFTQRSLLVRCAFAAVCSF